MRIIGWVLRVLGETTREAMQPARLVVPSSVAPQSSSQVVKPRKRLALLRCAFDIDIDDTASFPEARRCFLRAGLVAIDVEREGVCLLDERVASNEGFAMMRFLSGIIRNDEW